MAKNEAVKHPMQPLVMEGETVRFNANPIVLALLDFGKNHGLGLNELACRVFTNEDFEQFAQLIGYSVGGFGELSYVSDEAYAKAERARKRLLKSQPKRKVRK